MAWTTPSRGGRLLLSQRAGSLVITSTEAFAPKAFFAEEPSLRFLRETAEAINGKRRDGLPLGVSETELVDMLQADVAHSPGKNNGCGGAGCSCSAGPSRSLELFLLLAQFCNLSCLYCLDGSETYQKSRNRRMDAETGKLAIKRFVETLRSGDSFTLTLFGGEPLLHWRIAPELLSFARRLCRDRLIKFGAVVQSNLTFLPPSFIVDVREFGIQVLAEIDGPEDLHNKMRPHRDPRANSYRATAASLSKLRQAGIPFVLRATITSENVGQLVEIADLHTDFGANGTVFGLLRPVDSDGYEFDERLMPDPAELAAGIRSLMGKRPNVLKNTVEGLLSRMRPERNARACGAAHMGTPAVDANGDIYSCVWFVGQQERLLGNVRAVEFIEPVAEKRNYDDFDPEADPVCRNCDHFTVCLGGCSATRLIAQNAADQPRLTAAMRDQQCAVVKTIIDELLQPFHDIVSRADRSRAVASN